MHSVKETSSTAFPRILNATFQTSLRKQAVRHNGKVVTYGELWGDIESRGNHLSQHFAENLCDNMAGLLFEDTYELIVSQLACIAKNIPYFVLDCHLPPSRVKMMVTTAGMTFCVTDLVNRKVILQNGLVNTKLIQVNAIDKTFADTSNKVLFENKDRNQLAYVIFTSGSTGNPKGIRHTWGEVDDNLMWMLGQQLAIPSNHRVLQLIPFYSDPSLRQLLWPLANGGSILTLGQHKSNQVPDWASMLSECSVTDIFIVPTLLKAFLDYVKEENLYSHKIERVFTVGEPLLQTTANTFYSLFPNSLLYNQYGVSEISGNLTHHKVLQNSLNCNNFVPIGSILSHFEYQIIDENFNSLKNVNQVGMLAVKHSDMRENFNCYLCSEQLDKFARLGEAGKTFFLTEDQFLIFENNILVFQGRQDFQVKILGHRIELLEIERVLCSFDGVKNAAVVCKEDSVSKYLVAFIEVSKGFDDLDTLKLYLRDNLPKYMIPGKIVKMMISFPQLPNGKLDRVALAKMPLDDCNQLQRKTLPTNELERNLLDCFELVFHDNPEISMDTDFFEIGGNSLLIHYLSRLLSLKFGFKVSTLLIAENPTATKLAKKIRMESITNGAGKSLVKLPKFSLSTKFPLHSLQLAYVAGTMESGVEIHDYIEFKCNKLFVPALSLAFNKVLEKHEMLRCILVDDEYHLILEPTPKYEIKVYQFLNHDVFEVGAHLVTLRNDLSHQSIDLTKFPCFDIRLTQTNLCDYLHISINGTFIDASSFQKILTDWSYFYCNSEAVNVSPSFSFSQYISHLNELSGSSEAFCFDKAFWVARLPTFPPGPELPLVSKALASKTSQYFERLSDSIYTEKFSKLQQLADSAGLSMNTILLTAFSDTISRFSTNKYFGINVTVENRLPIDPKISEIVGNFTSTILLDVKYEHLKDFKARAMSIQNKLSELLDHSTFSGVNLQKELLSISNNEEVRQYPVVFTNLLGLNRDYRSLFGGQYIETSFHITQTPQVWIDCKVYADIRGLVLEWDCLVGIFPPGLLSAMHEMFCGVLNNLSSQNLELVHNQMFPNGLLDMAAKNNDTIRYFEKAQFCLHELFFQSVSRHGDNVAVRTEDSSFSYGQLSNMVKSFSSKLVALGLTGKNVPLLGIMMGKGWEQVVSGLAVNTVGAAYVPLDPSWPKSRILQIVHQCNLKHIIVIRKADCENIEEIELIDMSWVGKLNSESDCLTLNAFASKSTDLAYVIFTSGTTGVPKGVCVSHQAAVNTILDMISRCSITEKDSVLALSEMYFDLSVYDIFGTLASGGCIVLPGGNSKLEPSKWVSLIKENKVTIWNSVPALFQMLHDYVNGTVEGKVDSLRWIWLSGDRIPLSLPYSARQFLDPNCEILSLGGATEAAIWSIAYPISQSQSGPEPHWKSIPYGKPLANQRLYVLDTNFEICPLFVEGELYIAGTGLAEGYLNDKEKSRDSFFHHPVTHERLYRTGDYGRYMADGNIEFIGRKDNQVKLSGYRIELDEIKEVILKHYSVSDAIVKISKSQNQLAAFVTPLQPPATSLVDVEWLYNFKKLQPGLRTKFPEAYPKEILLPLQIQNRSEYFQRKSYRSFLPETVSSSVVTDLLNKIYNYDKHKSSSNAILTIESITKLLAPLSQFRDQEKVQDFPKYLYSSAGTLYPVQVYLIAGDNALDGLESGTYYYDPVVHRLIHVAIDNQNFCKLQLVLVGKHSAIDPIYQSDSECLLQLNAGYLLGALAKGSIGFRWRLKDIQNHLRNQLDISKDDQILVVLDLDFDEGEELESVFPMQQIYSCSKSAQSKYINSNGLIFNRGKILNKIFPKSFSLSGETSSIFGEASSALLFTENLKSNIDIKISRIQAGFWAHIIMVEATSLSLGFCPIGTTQGIEVEGDESIVHVMFGGRVSESELNSKYPSSTIPIYGEQLKARLSTFLVTQLSGYMVPREIFPLANWPLTANGKINENALQEMWSASKSSLMIESNENHIRNTKNMLSEFLINIVKSILSLTECNLQDNFYRLGGNSISAVKLMSRLKRRLGVFGLQLSVKDILQNPNLHCLFELINSRLSIAKAANPADNTFQIKPREHNSSYFALSPAQKRLFFLHKLNPKGCEYNIPIITRLKGKLDVEALSQSLLNIVSRHEILRTGFFVITDGQVFQKVSQLGDISNPLLKQKIMYSETELLAAIEKEVNKPFELSRAPLLRATLFQLCKTKTQVSNQDQVEERVLVIVKHHIVSDGSSVGILAEELSTIYNSLVVHDGSIQLKLPQFKVQYGDYAEWNLEQQAANLHSLSYWKEHLASSKTLNLPTQKIRPKVFTNRGGQVSLRLNAELCAKLKNFAIHQDTTLYCVLLSISSALLCRYSGEDSVSIGSPVTSRLFPELEKLVGFFVNTTVHKIDMLEDSPFSKFVSKITEQVIDSMQHQHVGLEGIIDGLGLERDLSRNPLFQVMLTLQNIKSNFDLNLKGISAQEMSNSVKTAKFDLSFIFKEDEVLGEISLDLEYYKDVYSNAFVSQLAIDFCTYSEQCICGNWNSLTNQIPLSSCNTNFDFGKEMGLDCAIQEVFRKQVEKFPNNNALTDGSRMISYKELNQLSDTISQNLKNLQFEIGKFVPILSTSENKLNSIVLMIGILKAGKAYVIIDAELPLTRISFILEEIKSQFVLADFPSDIDSKVDVPSIKHFYFDDIIKVSSVSQKFLQNSPIDPTDAFCMIYTSGTTGLPKGVVLSHKSIIRLVVSPNYIQFEEKEVIAQIAPLFFDACHFEIYGALLNGGSLVVISKNVLLDSSRFQNVVHKQGVTIMLMATSLFNSKIEVCPQTFNNLKALIIGGEGMNVDKMQKLKSNVANPPKIILNAYGPTENGVITTTYKVELDSLSSKTTFIPIGKAISQTFCVVMDRNLQPLPPFFIGELYTGGNGLALGYYNRAEETEKVFVRFLGRSWYKTGDLVSSLPDGSLRYHRRLDDQIKIRGHRVEVAEIEQALRTIEGVRDVAVTLNKVNSSLWAFLVINAAADLDLNFETKVKSLLPTFMTPQKYFKVESLPLKSNGKTDFPKLFIMTKQELNIDANNNEIAEPQDVSKIDSDITEWLFALWQEELNVSPEAFNSSSNFFRVGGHSLIAVTVVHKINQKYLVDISIKDFFTYPTISQISKLISKQQNLLNNHGHGSTIAFESISEVSNKFEPFPLLELQTAYLIGRQLSGGTAAHIYFEFEFKQLNLNRLNLALNRLVQRHEMLRCIMTKDGNQKIIASVSQLQIPCLVAETLENTRASMSHAVIDLQTFPTFDVRLTRFAETNVDVLHLSFDGLFMDALSLNIFLREWSQLYDDPDSLSDDLTFSFRDYVYQTQKSKMSNAYLRAEKYFLDRIQTFPTAPQLPINKIIVESNHMQNTSKMFQRACFKIGEKEWIELKMACANHDLSPTMVMLSAYGYVLEKFSENSHFAVNLTLFNRPPLHGQINKVIGEFTTTALLEMNFTAKSTTFLEQTQTIQNRMLEDLDNRIFPTIMFQRELGKKFGNITTGSYPFVFTSLLNVLSTDRNELFSNSFLKQGFSITQTPQVHIDCKVFEDQGCCVVEWDYLEQSFPPGFINDMVSYYENIMKAVVDKGLDQIVHQVVVTPFDILVNQVNSTERDLNYSNCCLHEPFLKNVINRGSSLAIISPDGQFSYQQLYRSAAVFAKKLEALKPSSCNFVGICLEKSVNQIVAVLGSMMCGVGYVPIDPNWPIERVKSILEQCGITVLVTCLTSALHKNLELDLSARYKLVSVDEHSGLENTFTSLHQLPNTTNFGKDKVAYIIFTSGSTGTPKGVAVTHRSA